MGGRFQVTPRGSSGLPDTIDLTRPKGLRYWHR